MISNINLQLSYNDLNEKICQWEKNKSINPFTKRKICIGSSTYINLKNTFNNFRKYRIYITNKKLTKIDHVIQNIFINKNFYDSYNKEIKIYLYILTYLEFRTREMYLKYIYIPEKFENIEIFGQPFKDKRIYFYKMMTLNMIPNYISFLINNNIEDKSIISLQILYKSYYELLSEHSFEHKIVVSDKDIKYEIQYIKEEFKDTEEFFYKKLDEQFNDIPKYKNIKKIHNRLSISNLFCDTCGKKYAKYICECGINIYCNEKCKNKDFKYHYENCKYISNIKPKRIK